MTGQNLQHELMNKILITGATGNVGREVLHFLSEKGSANEIFAATRNPRKGDPILRENRNVKPLAFDFEDPATFDAALQGIDLVFLLRPPHISDVKKYFVPLIEAMQRNSVRGVVFLSVQGAERSKVIPHNKIERLLAKSGLPYVFLRPSYFMQNLTTTLAKDIREKRKIILPAGKAKFLWVDARDIGEAAALVLNDFENYEGRAIELTGYDLKNFEETAGLLREITQLDIRYKNLNPISFFRLKRKEGMPAGMVMVMIMLHFLPRFQKAPEVSKFYEESFGKKPTSLREFLEREMEGFKPHSKE